MKKQLIQWILDFFKKNQFTKQQAFNVHAFTELEKAEAINLLAIRYNFFLALENNNNSLNITRN